MAQQYVNVLCCLVFRIRVSFVPVGSAIMYLVTSQAAKISCKLVVLVACFVSQAAEARHKFTDLRAIWMAF